MTNKNSKITVHMVSSLDGYVVRGEGDVSWLETKDTYQGGVESDDPEAFLENLDCWVIGSKTYEHALSLGWPYGDTPTFVLTRRELSSDRANVQFRSGDLERFVTEELRPNYPNAWLCGGSALVKEFLRLDLVDEICHTIAPILIGEGLPFYDQIGVERPLHLKEAKAYKSGVVELSYEVLRPSPR